MAPRVDIEGGPEASPTVAVKAPFDEPAEARRLRRSLLAELRSEEVSDPRVLRAMDQVPRHVFVPDVPLDVAYLNRPLSIGWGQTISQPLIVGIMTEKLALSGTERVLEIGTGSGYQAAILSLLAREVLTIEVVEPLARLSRNRLASLGYDNVTVRAGDGYAGWPERAPFDRIVLTAAPLEVPRELLTQLADGGVLVAPLGAPHARQDLVRIFRRGARFEEEQLGPVAFVPMVHGVGTAE